MSENEDIWLEHIRKLTKEMLYQDIEVDEEFPWIVHHPIFSEVMNGVNVDGELQLLNLTDSRERAILLNEREKQIDRSNDAMSIYMMISKPWRLHWVNEIMLYVTDSLYYSLLTDAWMSSEMNHQYDMDNILYMFERVRYMFPDLSDKYPDGVITIYRGENSYEFHNGLSWTVDKAKALWFARRFGNHRNWLATAEVKLSDVIAHFLGDSTGEQEVIVDPRKITFKLEEVE